MESFVDTLQPPKHRFRLVFHSFMIFLLTFFENYFSDFAICIKNYADSDFDALIYDL